MRVLVHDVPYWDALFSKTIPCPVCTKGEQEAYLDRICGLSDEMKAWRFDNTIRHADNAAAYDGALALADNPAWLFVMHGNNGVGKTRLLACLVNECRARGWVSLYYTTAQVLDHLRAAYAPNAPESIDHMWGRLIGARVLALDEFDKWNPKPWAEEKFFELVDERYRNGAQCLTAFASNADIETGPGYVVSRMHDRRCQIHHIQGEDVRRLRK